MGLAAYTLPPGPGLFIMLFTGLAAAGLGTGALQARLYALAASAYDTPIRSRGLGVAAMMSRMGAITTSFAGGGLLSWAHEGGFFALLAAVAAAAALGVALVDRHVQGREPGHVPHALGPASE